MNLQEAKKQMREILGRMALENAPEILLEAGTAPIVKAGREARAWDTPPWSTELLDSMAQAIMLEEQWSDFMRARSCRTFSFQLLALGIGRFHVEAVGYDSILSLTVKPVRRPADDAHVPFVPADHPPSLSAEAIPQI